MEKVDLGKSCWNPQRKLGRNFLCGFHVFRSHVFTTHLVAYSITSETTTVTQRERHETKGFMSRTMAVHVRYKSLNTSLPSSAKQEREMNKFFVFRFGIERRHRIVNLSTFLKPEGELSRSRQLRITLVNINSFLNRRHLRCLRRRCLSSQMATLAGAWDVHEPRLVS